MYPFRNLILFIFSVTPLGDYCHLDYCFVKSNCQSEVSLTLCGYLMVHLSQLLLLTVAWSPWISFSICCVPLALDSYYAVCSIKIRWWRFSFLFCLGVYYSSVFALKWFYPSMSEAITLNQINITLALSNRLTGGKKDFLFSSSLRWWCCANVSRSFFGCGAINSSVCV